MATLVLLKRVGPPRPHRSGPRDGPHGPQQQRSWHRLRLMSARGLRNDPGWYLHLVMFAEGEDEKRYEGAKHAESRHPPDVPDQRETGDDRKECRDEAGRAVFPHLYRLVGTGVLCSRLW